MSQRMDIVQSNTEAVKGLFQLEKYLSTSGLNRTHKELLKIRASQINGCAYCINMHTREARKAGETEQRIYLLNAWRETTTLFTEEEKAVLALTEEVTLISQGGVLEETYAKARMLFDEAYIANLIMAIVAINAWNRIAVATHKELD